MPGVLLIGDGDLAEETCRALEAAGADVDRMESPDEPEVRAALEAGRVDQVAVVSRDDAVALRSALMVRFVDARVPLLVTIFHPTMADQVRTAIEHCTVTSMADIVAPSLAGPCLGEDLIAVRADGDPPVVVGRGADPSLLRRVSLARARALAAVTDDDLENISIAMTARAVNPDLRVVLRAGDGRVANETRSLFRIGLVRDVHRIAAALLAARATGSPATRVVCRGDDAHLLHPDGSLERAPLPATV